MKTYKFAIYPFYSNYLDNQSNYDQQYIPKVRSSSKKHKKRGSSQKRDRSSCKRSTDVYAKLIRILQEEVGTSDPSHVTLLPIDAPYLQNEELLFIHNNVNSIIQVLNEDFKLDVLIIKSAARIKTLNKICMILKNELSLSKDKIDKIMVKYQKAVEEGVKSDKKLIEIQRELS